MLSALLPLRKKVILKLEVPQDTLLRVCGPFLRFRVCKKEGRSTLHKT